MISSEVPSGSLTGVKTSEPVPVTRTRTRTSPGLTWSRRNRPRLPDQGFAAVSKSEFLDHDRRAGRSGRPGPAPNVGFGRTGRDGRPGSIGNPSSPTTTLGIGETNVGELGPLELLDRLLEEVGARRGHDAPGSRARAGRSVFICSGRTL